MIDSPIHRRGGPLFFALSLVPLFLLAWWLRGQEQKRRSMKLGLLQRLFCWAAFVCPGGYTVRPALHRWRGVRIGPGVWISSLVVS